MSRTARNRRLEDGRWEAYLPFFNPGSTVRIRSILRVVNPTERERTVWLSAWDQDYVEGTATIVCVVPALNAIDFSGRALEESPLEGDLGEGGCTGEGWGDGRAKWWVRVKDAEPREEPLIAMGLTLSDSTGLVTNVSHPFFTQIGTTEGEGPGPTPDDFAPADSCRLLGAGRGQKNHHADYKRSRNRNRGRLPVHQSMERTRFPRSTRQFHFKGRGTRKWRNLEILEAHHHQQGDHADRLPCHSPRMVQYCAGLYG